MTVLLKATRISKLLGQRLLLDIDVLALDAGAAYVLTGVNGSGKSTLLRALAGLDSVSCGSLEFEGQALALAPYPAALRSATVYVHQHPIMFSTSVMDNIAYGLRARGMARGAAQVKAMEAMAWAGLAHVSESDPARLSGGEKQRVALARAKVMHPRLMLLDEPTANLDGPAREQVIALIPSLAAQGCTVVMACHDRDLIALPGVRRMKLRDAKLEYK